MPDDPPASGGEPEIDAEAATAIRRARRSFGVSMLILIAGLMAVAVAVVYRLNRDADPAPAIAEIAMPAGAEVVSAVLADGKLTVTYRQNGATAIRIVDAGSGAVLSEIAVVGE
jgi:hypothetical protein